MLMLLLPICTPAYQLAHTPANQLLPQLLIEQFDTLLLQCRHIEHMHEGVWFGKKLFLTK